MIGHPDKPITVQKMKKYLLFLIPLIVVSSCIKRPKTVENMWPSNIERNWIGSQFLSVQQKDWKLDSGKLICVNTGSKKGVVVLTRQITNPIKGFEISFEAGLPPNMGNQYRQGMILGLENPTTDSVDFSKGLFAGVASNGTLFLGKKSTTIKTSFGDRLIFDLEAIPLENRKLHLLLRIRGGNKDNQLAELTDDINPDLVKGLISFFVTGTAKGSKQNVIWFESLEINGDGVRYFPNNARGPILKIDHKHVGDSLKITAFIAPVIIDNKSKVVLQTRHDGEWTTIEKAAITPTYTVKFAIPYGAENEHLEYRIYTHYIDNYGTTKYQYVTRNKRDFK